MRFNAASLRVMLSPVMCHTYECTCNCFANKKISIRKSHMAESDLLLPLFFHPSVIMLSTHMKMCPRGTLPGLNSVICARRYHSLWLFRCTLIDSTSKKG